MAELVWGEDADKIYQLGIDRGLFQNAFSEGLSGPATWPTPWPGLISVEENFKDNVETVYWDGVAIHNIVTPGDYEAKVNAIHRPDSFMEYDGNRRIKSGVYLGGQAPKTFNFSWRSGIGNAQDGNFSNYKIHFLYNVVAVLDSVTSSTISDSPSFSEFNWIFRPTPFVEDSTIRNTAKVELDLSLMPSAAAEVMYQLTYTDMWWVPGIWPAQQYISVANSYT